MGRYQDCIGAPTGREWWPSAGDTTYRHGAFKSAASAAYHPEMCRRLAMHFAQELSDKRCGRLGRTSPSVGGSGASSAGRPQEQAPLFMPIDLNVLMGRVYSRS